MMRRRDFVAGAGSLVAIAGLMPGRLFAATADPVDQRVVAFAGGFSKDKFAALLNQTFYITTENAGVVIVQLVQVTEPNVKSPAPTNPEQFSIVFRGPALPALPSGTYEVEHYLAGKTLLYLEATTEDRSASVYRADFNLLR